MSHRVVYEESSTNGLGPTGWKDEAIFFAAAISTCPPGGARQIISQMHHMGITTFVKLHGMILSQRLARRLRKGRRSAIHESIVMDTANHVAVFVVDPSGDFSLSRKRKSKGEGR